MRLSAGLAIWAAVFASLYAVHGVGCAAGWAGRPVAGTDLQRVVLFVGWGVGTAVAAIVAVGLQRRLRSNTAAPTLDRAAVRLACVAVAATAITGLPIVLVPTCL